MTINKGSILFLHAGAELYGADRNILRVIEALVEQGYTCCLMTPNDGPLLVKARQRQIECIVEPFPILRRATFSPRGLLQYFCDYVRCIGRIRKHIVSRRISVIHSNTLVVMPGAFFYKNKNLRHVWHLRETIWKPWVVKKLLYGIVKLRADHIVCVSEAVSKALGYSPKSIVLHNGIEPVIENITLEHPKVSGEIVTVGVLGRFNAIKGQIDLAKAACYIRAKYGLTNIRYHFAGGVFGDNTYWLDLFKDFIQKNNLTEIVTISEFTENVAGFFSHLDVFVLPSTSPDSFPTVVLESMSAGVPVIGYRNGGIEEILDNDTECLAKLGDFEALAEHLVRMVVDDAYRYKKAVAQHTRFKEEYAIQVFRKNITDFYTTITSNS